MFGLFHKIKPNEVRWRIFEASVPLWDTSGGDDCLLYGEYQGKEFSCLCSENGWSMFWAKRNVMGQINAYFG